MRPDLPVFTGVFPVQAVSTGPSKSYLQQTTNLGVRGSNPFRCANFTFQINYLHSFGGPHFHPAELIHSSTQSPAPLQLAQTVNALNEPSTRVNGTKLF